MKEEILIFGAGALSLGFLGPMLTEDYLLVFCDLPVKDRLIDWLQENGTYTVNICGRTVAPLRISGVTGYHLSRTREQKKIQALLRKVRIVYTAVGTQGIDKVLAFIRDSSRGRKEKLFVFLSENDKSVFSRWAGRLGSQVRLCDTIMARMCRIDKAGESYQPLYPGFEEAVIAEDFSGLPVTEDIHREANLKGKAWQVMSEDKFEAKSRLKLYGHNGAHAYLSYLGALQGYTYFYEVNGPLVSEARHLLNREVIPALLHQYRNVLQVSELNGYAGKLLKRITSRTFADTIARGIRGSLAKIAPGERLIEGARFILANGISPEYFCRIIAAGIKLNMKTGLLPDSLEKVLSEHCHIKEPELIGLIKKGMKVISADN